MNKKKIAKRKFFAIYHWSKKLPFVYRGGRGGGRAAIGCPVPFGVSGFCRAGYGKAPAAAGAFG